MILYYNFIKFRIYIDVKIAEVTSEKLLTFINLKRTFNFYNIEEKLGIFFIVANIALLYIYYFIFRNRYVLFVKKAAILFQQWRQKKPQNKNSDENQVCFKMNLCNLI